jgi:hypothetical protein
MTRSSKEGLLSRWSRLKRSSTESAADDEQAGVLSTTTTAATPAVDDDEGPASDAAEMQPLPELPPIDELTPDSDFQPFMDPRVEDGVRRAALKTLFRSADFNITDGLDVYAEDYSKLEKLTPAMVATLKYAQRTLLGQDDGKRMTARAAASDGLQDEAGGVGSPVETDDPIETGEAIEAGEGRDRDALAQSTAKGADRTVVAGEGACAGETASAVDASERETSAAHESEPPEPGRVLPLRDTD